AAEVPGDQLGRQLVLVEQIRREEGRRLFGVVTHHPIGRPEADLGVFIAEEPRQFLERPESLGHSPLPGSDTGIIADRRARPHRAARGSSSTTSTCVNCRARLPSVTWKKEEEMAERGGFEPPTPVLASVTA